MEEQLVKKRIWFLFSLIFFFLSSATVWFIPLSSFEGEAWQRVIAYILGVLFWLGLAAGIFFMLLIGRERKKKMRKRAFPFISFFSNKIAIVFDTLFIIGLIGIICVLFIQGINQWLSAFIIFIFIFSLEMHGVFNGENYKYILNQVDKREG